MNDDAGDHLETGKWGEDMAERMLRKKGYRILAKRLRVGTRDEIDIVAAAGDVLVFVEIKTRGSEDFGRPAVSVDARKRRVLSRAAVRYVKALRRPRVIFRFDVVEVIGRRGDENPVIRHIENAFSLDRLYMLPA